MRALTALSFFTSLATAVYTIQDEYTPNNFASMFDFFTGVDPTDGYVNYVDQATAQNDGLYKIQNNQIYMGVDASNPATGRGRDSIRISSKKVYNHGLIILDLAHMPGGACGTWPAFWLLGPNWPNGGEIDIIEGVNTQVGNSFALHTNSGCSITNTGNFAGTLKTSNCDSYAPDQDSNAGCAIASNNGQSYGKGFNAVGGGVYATEWTSEAISIWFFPRSAIPSDITQGTPNPDNWGLPSAQFAGACDIDKHVVNQQIIFDITFCGQWAGSVWKSDTTCGPLANSCQEYVQLNPGAFVDTYWSINGLKVYQENGAAVSTTQAVTTSTAAPISTPLESTMTLTTLTTLTKTVASSNTIVVTIPTSTAATTTSTTATPPPPPTTAPPPPTTTPYRPFSTPTPPTPWQSWTNTPPTHDTGSTPWSGWSQYRGGPPRLRARSWSFL